MMTFHGTQFLGEDCATVGCLLPFKKMILEYDTTHFVIRQLI